MSGARGMVGDSTIVCYMAPGAQLIVMESIDDEFVATVWLGSWPKGSALTSNTFKAADALIVGHIKPELSLRGVMHKLPFLELMRVADALRLDFADLIPRGVQVPA